MGNRAVITTSLSPDPQNDFQSLGLYLHWDGDINHVQAFLTYCDLHGYRTPDVDCYGWTMLACVIGNYFRNGLSCGVDVCANLDCNNGNNGTYFINGWSIASRFYAPQGEPETADEDAVREILLRIDSCMPEPMQLGRSELLTRYDHLLDPVF